MNGPQIHPASFRDPDGFLFSRDGVLYRQVNLTAREAYDRLLGSGLYASLTEQGLLVTHAETTEAPAREGAYKVIRPEPVPFISYPYEWCFSQLRQAALLMLKLQRLALEAGLSLKDASAYNVQFLDGNPVLIDTLSFDVYREGAPWVAYRQFCQQFLAPLALMARRDVRLGRLSQLYLDGVPLDLACSLLPARTRLSPGLLLHLYLHSDAQAKYTQTRPTAARMSRQALLGLVDSLEGTVRAIRPPVRARGWGGYYEDNSYSNESMEHKKALVSEMIDAVRPAPRLCWDLGANTGLFSRLAGRRGIFTVAFDLDEACVERNFSEEAASGGSNLLPLVLDLANPSPAIGWAHDERLSWLGRGPADLVLALALVHHLAISNNVPLARIADLLAASGRWVIAEFVPKEDSQARKMLATREDVFPRYTRENFEETLRSRFSIRRAERIAGTERNLYLLERTAA